VVDRGAFIRDSIKAVMIMIVTTTCDLIQVNNIFVIIYKLHCNQLYINQLILTSFLISPGDKRANNARHQEYTIAVSEPVADLADHLVDS
jgi:hypothetical protein